MAATEPVLTVDVHYVAEQTATITRADDGSLDVTFSPLKWSDADPPAEQPFFVNEQGPWCDVVGLFSALADAAPELDRMAALRAAEQIAGPIDLDLADAVAALRELEQLRDVVQDGPGPFNGTPARVYNAVLTMFSRLGRPVS